MAQLEPNLEKRNLKYKFGDWVSNLQVDFCYSISSSSRIGYFGTSGGIQRFDVLKKEFISPLTTSDGFIGNKAYIVAFDRLNSTLWSASDKGISFWSEISERVRNISNSTILIKIPQITFEDQLFITNIGFGEGKVFFRIQAFQTYYLSTQANGSGFLSLVEDVDLPPNIEWFGWSQNTEIEFESNWNLEGNFRMDLQEKAFVGTEFEKYRITFKHQDRFGMTYFGTNSNLLAVGRTVGKFLKPYQIAPLKKEVTSILYNGNELVLGSKFPHRKFKGFSIFDYQTNSWNYFDSREDYNIREDRVLKIKKIGNTYFFGTLNGLVTYNSETDYWNQLTLASGLADEEINDIIKVGSEVWLLTVRGISVVTLNGSLILSKDLRKDFRDKEFYETVENKETIWLASSSGIFIYDKKEKTFELFTKFGERTIKPSYNPVKNLALNKTHLFWNNDVGVFKMDLKTQQVEILPLKRYPLGEKIRDILVDSGNLWLATNEGLFEFEFKNQKWTHYTEKDGLPSDNLFCLAWDLDFIKIGSDNGITNFYWNNPRRIKN
ncbi:MAG: hypothetical protein DWQ06_08175 [Calditrichaeota bacterium]|nr:MAG: hypothetical protein DWQ06_08175 [Calditrichota bacterium]